MADKGEVKFRLWTGGEKPTGRILQPPVFERFRATAQNKSSVGEGKARSAVQVSRKGAENSMLAMDTILVVKEAVSSICVVVERHRKNLRLEKTE
jgi:hypothetical protein